MDGDGDLDLALGNWGIEVYENDGQGNFIPHELGTEYRSTTSIAWGDMDGDGDNRQSQISHFFKRKVSVSRTRYTSIHIWHWWQLII